jgi:hypothetical protein
MGLFSQIDAVEILKRDNQIASLTAEIERLREALRHWVFLYAWKADGMNMEQAKIHADAFMMSAALQVPSTEQAPPKAIRSPCLECGCETADWMQFHKVGCAYTPL